VRERSLRASCENTPAARPTLEGVRQHEELGLGVGGVRIADAASHV